MEGMGLMCPECVVPEHCICNDSLWKETQVNRFELNYRRPTDGTSFLGKTSLAGP